MSHSMGDMADYRLLGETKPHDRGFDEADE